MSLTTIGNYAFEGCSSLTELSLSAALTTLGIGAFEDTSLSPTAREAISALTYRIPLKLCFEERSSNSLRVYSARAHSIAKYVRCLPPFCYTTFCSRLQLITGFPRISTTTLSTRAQTAD